MKVLLLGAVTEWKLGTSDDQETDDVQGSNR